MIRIREASRPDREPIREVHSCAFSGGEEQVVAQLAVDLLGEETTPGTFALVAETDGEVVGHVAFSPVTIADNDRWTGYILAPLGVKPACQKRRVGSKLVESGLQRLSGKGVNVVFVYGDPAYYGRFGFSAGAASAYLAPYALQYPFGWQAIALNEEEPRESAVTLSCVASLRDPGLW